jgi:prepilin-type N-terminal cleavage/methylation domain-containing protein
MKKNIPDTKYQIQNTNNAFTLIEILVAIGIISILAAVVLVSMKSFGARGRSAKALGQLSSVIPSMVSCWGNGNEVKEPSSGDEICKEAGAGGADIDSYGKWPDVDSGNLKDYDYSSNSGSGKLPKTNWYVRLKSSDDKQTICCNSTMNNCSSVNYISGNADCDANTPSN